MTKIEETTLTKIMGNVVATVKQMTAYIKAKNPDVAQSVIDMIPLYLSEGKAEGGWCYNRRKRIARFVLWKVLR